MLIAATRRVEEAKRRLTLAERDLAQDYQTEPENTTSSTKEEGQDKEANENQ